VIALHYFGGLTLREVADATGTRKGTVDSRLNRGLEELRQELSLNASLAGPLVIALLRQGLTKAPAAPAAAAVVAAATEGAASGVARILGPLLVVLVATGIVALAATQSGAPPPSGVTAHATPSGNASRRSAASTTPGRVRPTSNSRLEAPGPNSPDGVPPTTPRPSRAPRPGTALELLQLDLGDAKDPETARRLKCALSASFPRLSHIGLRSGAETADDLARWLSGAPWLSRLDSLELVGALTGSGVEALFELLKGHSLTELRVREDSRHPWPRGTKKRLKELVPRVGWK
ncbi:MAG: hypothetical protein JKY65_01850, partial [Planctomycetes bacterium]|nr:hypothetical protein [Planctomycetota bacterium]